MREPRADPKGYESPAGGQSPVFWPDISSGSLRVSLLGEGGGRMGRPADRKMRDTEKGVNVERSSGRRTIDV